MQKINVSEYVTRFLTWLKSNKAGDPEWMKGWEEERKQRRAWYKEKLSQKEISSLREQDFAKLVKDLWATLIWSNKDYKVKKLIEDNSFPKLKSSLKELLYSSETTEKRWDSFRASIKGFGPSSMSEILAFSDPDKYGIINLKPLSLLPVLGVITETQLKSFNYYSLNGKKYVSLLDILSKVRKILQENGLPKADYIDTDFFIAYLFYDVFKLYKERDKQGKVQEALGKVEKAEGTKTIEPAIKVIGKVTVHKEAEYALLKLGILLGFDTYTPDRNEEAFGESLSKYTTLKELPPFTHEDFLKTVKEIDVIWFKDEFPEVCFEVEHTTGVALGLLRLYHVRKFNTKLFIVAPKEVNTKYETEVNKEPFRQMKERYNFRSYEELEEFFSLAESYTKSRKSFLETR